MAEFGFIHDKLDIKILILFILARLPGPIGAAALSDLVMSGGGIGYFDYTDCLSELIGTRHVVEEEDGYSITEKGRRNGETIESSLPYSLRKKITGRIASAASAMKRSSMITASHKSNNDLSVTVELSMSDGAGEIVFMRLLVPDEDSAFRAEKIFRAGAEEIYNKIIDILN
ncbi:MAG: DUF4364 family protein [Oscillospiraceae bacterium]|nr:DUF4364 family protein [Oscillospiraceae bacterium]